MLICNFCSATFTRKDNLRKHYTNKKCTYNHLDDCLKALELNDKLNGVSSEVNTQVNNGIINNGNINIIINVEVNPVTSLNTTYIEPSKMKTLVEDYSYLKLNYLLSDYIKEIIHNKEHPENHSVKYIKKKPPTFSNTISHEGKRVHVIKNLKDSCELLSEPVLLNLKQKLKECKKTYKKDEDFQDMYEDTVCDIYRELNKDSVKKALSTVLQTDILNDIEMKCSTKIN